MTEEERYTAVQDQINNIQDTAMNDANPVESLLAAMLTAEMYVRNERHHMRVVEAQREFVGTLWAVIGHLQA